MGQESRKLTDDYKIAYVLGRGGFSIVRLGKKKRPTMRGNDQVAIKTLKHLVLVQSSSSSSYSEVEAAGAVRQIASGLWAEIVHRDLKPENCLFLDSGKNSTSKMMDFGLSSVEEFTDLVVGFGLFGSIDYVSPEALARAKVTAATDLWCQPFMAQSNKQKQQMREILCRFTTLRNSRGHALRLCFQMYDTDRSGCITKEEVASMLRALPDDCLPADITEPGKLDEVFTRWMLTMMEKLLLTSSKLL